MIAVIVLGAGVWWWATRPEAPAVSGTAPTPTPTLTPAPSDDGVAHLLSQADRQFQAGRLDSPEGDNAVASYREVLALDDDNAQALAGLDRVVSRFVVLIDQSLEANDLDKASGYLASAEGIAPADQQVASARARLEKVSGGANDAKTIREWLAAADEDMGAGRLQKAVKRYRAVLELDPDNQGARAGLREVVTQYIALANHAVNSRDPEQAEQLVARAETIAPGDERIAELRTRILAEAAATGRAKKTEKLLAEAEQDLQNNRLTSPKGNNAVERYRAILTIDPTSHEAKHGLKRVVDKYIRLADNAVVKGEFDKADGFLTKAESIAPGDVEIGAARTRLSFMQDQDSAHIEDLLAAGDKALQQGRLDEPKGNNALELYREVFKYDAENQAAHDRIRRLQEHILALGHDAIKSNDLGLAESYLAKAEKIWPGHPDLGPYRAKLQARDLTIAVFPFEFRSNCYYSVLEEVTDAVDTEVGNQPKARLAYSYYKDSADPNAVPGTKEIWSSTVTHRKPILETVREAGRKIGANGVFMAWYKCSRNEGHSVDTYEVDVYIVDTAQDRVFHAREKFLDVHRAISDVFDQFYAAHGFPAG
jgi:tetratricopeptide (TPR) repeat protein